MNTPRITSVLHVEDSPTDAMLIREEMVLSSQFQLTQVDRLEDALRVLAKGDCAVVLLDLGLPDSQGLETLSKLQRAAPHVPVVVITGNQDEQLGALAIQAGAQDFIVKGQTRENLLDRTLRYAIERNVTREALRERGALATLSSEVGLTFTSSASLREMLKWCAASVVENLEAVLARLWTLNPSNNALELQASEGIYANIDAASSRPQVGKYMIGLIAEGRKPYLTNDVSSNPRICDPEWAQRERITSFAGYPLVLENRLLGVVALFARRRLTDMTHQTLVSVANQIAVGIERKVKDEAVRVSEERFRELTEHIDQVLWMIDAKESKVLYVSHGYEKLWGRSRESLMGRPQSFMDGVVPEDQVRIRGEEAAMYRSGRIDTEFRVSRPDGSVRWVWNRGYPVTENGEIVRLVGVIEDITEKRRLAAERDKLLSRLQLHIQRLPLAYILFDAEMRIVDWNPVAERVFGYTREEMLGKGPPYEQFVPSSYWEKGEAIRKRIRAGDMETHAINENVTKDGRTIICQRFNTPLIEDGVFVGYLCLCQDITEQKSVEAQLRQAQKMEAVGQLAGGVAHDFNNLLTIISGYTEMLLSAIGSGEAMREPLMSIREAGERAAWLTRQLLAFSRKTVLDPEVLDLNEVVRETQKFLRRLIGEDILLTSVLDATISKVKVDPGQLGQVLMNLAVNARDAMPKGGKLTLETRNIELGLEYTRLRADVQPGHYVQLTIADTGVGMTPDVKARAFEPFFTTKEAGKGTGLGLAVVLGIVKQSDGHIEVYSEPGIGTTFKLFFPAVEKLPSTAKRGDSKIIGPGTETILLVEDEESVLKLALIILQTYRYKVLTATNGAEALRLVDKHQGGIDLLLTDVVMPGMGGPELAQALRPRYPTMKMLFSSGYTDDAIVRHGLLQEKVAFLQKPYSPVALARKVRQILDEKAESL